MNGTIRTLVALDSGVDPLEIEKTLPLNSDLDVVAYIDLLEDGWQTLLEERSDLLRRLARRTEGRARDRIEIRARDADEHAASLRDVLMASGRPTREAGS